VSIAVLVPLFAAKAGVSPGAQQSNELALVESAGLGAVAQLVEHLLGRQGVDGSNPFSSTIPVRMLSRQTKADQTDE
jgi:hypothetical protein